MSGEIWVLDDAVVDLLPDGRGRLLQCPDDAPANIAIGVTRLGGDSGFINRVGDDPFGHFIRHTLAQEQVDVSYIRLDTAQRTSTVVVDLDQHGKRTFTLMVRPSADLSPQPEDPSPSIAGRWPHVCSIAPSTRPSRNTAFAAMEVVKRAGNYVSFDPDIHGDLRQDPQDLHDCFNRALVLTDAIKLSEGELALVSGSDNIVSDIARLNVCFQLTLLLVIQGKAGVQVALRGQVGHFPAHPMAAIDTTGAGDVLATGLLAGLAAYGISDNLAALAPDLTLTQTYGVLVTTARGAMTALPYGDDLQRSLRSRWAG